MAKTATSIRRFYHVRGIHWRVLDLTSSWCAAQDLPAALRERRSGIVSSLWPWRGDVPNIDGMFWWEIFSVQEYTQLCSASYGLLSVWTTSRRRRDGGVSAVVYICLLLHQSLCIVRQTVIRPHTTVSDQTIIRAIVTRTLRGKPFCWPKWSLGKDTRWRMMTPRWQVHRQGSIRCVHWCRLFRIFFFRCLVKLVKVYNTTRSWYTEKTLWKRFISWCTTNSTASFRTANFILTRWFQCGKPAVFALYRVPQTRIVYNLPLNINDFLWKWQRLAASE